MLSGVGLAHQCNPVPDHLRNLPPDLANIVLWSAVVNYELPDRIYYRALSQDLAHARHTYTDALWRDTEE